MEETPNTGVIYAINNTANNKVYIGKAYSFVHNGASGYVRHGAQGRFKNHIKSAMNNSSDCPLLYKDMRHYGVDMFQVSVVEVCDKAHLREREAHHINGFGSCYPDKGYNFFVGDKKPVDPSHEQAYSTRKAQANVMRCQNGELKKNPNNIGLPPNISYRACRRNGNIISEGYFVQIKLNGVLRNKAFLSSKHSMSDKLTMAKEFLAKLVAEMGNPHPSS